MAAASWQQFISNPFGSELYVSGLYASGMLALLTDNGIDINLLIESSVGWGGRGNR